MRGSSSLAPRPAILTSSPNSHPSTLKYVVLAIRGTMRWSLTKGLTVLKTYLILAKTSATRNFRSKFGGFALLNSWNQFSTSPNMTTSDENSGSLLSWTASDFREFMENGTYTSRQLVELCLDQIDKHNKAGMKLRAMISVLPREQALALADQLDEDRERGLIRGKFHGIPIIVKDTINTDPSLNMPTTLGSPALLTTKPKGNAKIIDMLVREGAIILGKANLSEFGATKSGKAVVGYSPVGGQTQPAYVESGVLPDDTIMGNSNPGGSSSGSAVGVAAGFSPWSIGAETDGSLVTPASRSSLYALKPTIGSVSGDGVFMLTETMDSLGGLAKCVDDLALLTERLMSTSDGPKLNITSFDKKFSRFRIGFLDPNIWKLPTSLLEPTESYTRQTINAYQAAINLMEKHGATVVYPVELTPASKITYEGQSAYGIIRNGEFRFKLEEYLSDLDYSSIRTLGDVIKFNNDHPDLAFSRESPDQSKLIAMQNADITPEFLKAAVVAIRKAAGPGNIDRVLQEHELDVIIAPSDSPISTAAAISGYPIGTMPLGYLEENGRPFGLSILASAHEEAKILGVMASWEPLMRRKIPSPLLQWESKL
ncbi:putative amidase [Xylaria sp. FL1042]|nr:putative amidase [Xylaria sp. FL1042]